MPLIPGTLVDECRSIAQQQPEIAKQQNDDLQMGRWVHCWVFDTSGCRAGLAIPL